MVEGCGPKLVKFLVVFFNFLFCLAGAVVMGVSIWAKVDPNFSSTLTDILNKTGADAQPAIDQINTVNGALITLAVVGGIIFVVSFLGCAGALCENVCMLGTFFVFMLIMFLIELGLGIAVLVKKDTVQTELAKGIEAAIKLKDTDVQNNINTLQQSLLCCGGNGYSDYNEYGVPIPDSCCATPACTASNSYQTGCAKALLDKLLTSAGGVAIGFLVVELLAMIFTCCLCSSIRRRRDRPYY